MRWKPEATPGIRGLGQILVSVTLAQTWGSFLCLLRWCSPSGWRASWRCLVPAQDRALLIYTRTLFPWLRIGRRWHVLPLSGLSRVQRPQQRRAQPRLWGAGSALPGAVEVASDARSSALELGDPRGS